MEGEVRVTIIATGLPTVEAGTLHDDDISAFLQQALGGESDLDLPPFLRASHQASALNGLSEK